MERCPHCDHRDDVEPKHTPACPYWWTVDDDGNGGWM